MRRFDARLVIAVGLRAVRREQLHERAHHRRLSPADQLLWPNIVRAFGQALVFAPLSAIATAGIEPENAGSASALFNMMRNLGGAIGIAAAADLPDASASSSTPTS